MTATSTARSSGSPIILAPPAYQPRQRLLARIAKRAMVATGADERPIVFPDNDGPA